MICPKCIPPEINRNADFVYLRFHGEKGDYRGSYSDQYLQQKAHEIHGWLERGRDVYAISIIRSATHQQI
ncbi:MAG: DUF72 domain-containing protein [Puia sp.]